MFTSITSPNLNQNQISDHPNFESDSHPKTRGKIDEAYKSLNKNDDSDADRNNSNSRCSSTSNYCEIQNASNLFENN